MYVADSGGCVDKATVVFAFGKHRGKTFAEVAESDPSYCQWALKQDNPGGMLRDFVFYVRSRGGGSASRGTAQSQDAHSHLPCGGMPSTDFRGAPSRPNGPGQVFFAPGPKIDDGTLVCQLLSGLRFEVHYERSAALPNAFNAGNGGYVPNHIWRAIGSLPNATLSAERKGWVFPLSSYNYVVSALEELGPVERIPTWVHQVVDVAKNKEGHFLDEGLLPPQLLPYQLEGVQFGISRAGRCLIGDEMGLGKTLQALCLAAQYMEDWPVLVVCPSSLRWVWKEQTIEWLPQLVKPDEVQVIKKGSDKMNPAAKFWIISYNLLATDAKHGRFQQRPDGTKHAFVVADESHNMKEWQAARTKAMVPLLRAATRAVLLSGTPTRNSPEELHPQLCGLHPFPVKFQDFRARYSIQQQSQLFSGRMVSKTIGARNAAELHHLLTSTVMVRRLKRDVLAQLPEKRRQRIPIEVSDVKLLKEIRREMQALVDVIGEGGGEESISTLFLKTARAKLPAVKEYILEVLDRGDEKAIIFAHHRLMLDEISALLEKELKKDQLSHVRIDGGTAASKRHELVKQFQEDPKCRIALLSITACGEGLTLTAAGLVIFAELYWVPGAVEQAEARAHRIGTTHNKVVIEFLVVPNSPDERIYNCLERKKKDTSHVLDGVVESLEAVRQMRPERAPKRATPHIKDMLQESSVAESEEGRSKRRAVQFLAEDDASSPGPKPPVSQVTETPPPVDRSKLDFLLRAAQGPGKTLKL